MATQLVLQSRILITLVIPILPILIRMVTPQGHRKQLLITLAILLQTIGIVMGTHRVHLKQLQIILAIEILSNAVTIAIQLSGRGNRFPLEKVQSASDHLQKYKKFWK